jgi:hypothetical protein
MGRSLWREDWGCEFQSKSQSESHIATDGQSVSLAIEPHLGPMTRYLFLSDSYVLVSVGRPLLREDGSVFCMCRWPLPAQYFSNPSPLGLATVFYCLRFEISLFVDSYDSQGHGEGIQPPRVRVYVWMFLKSGLCVRDRTHFVARFMFPMLVLPWIPVIWFQR